MKETATYFNLTVLRGSKYIATEPFNGTKKAAIQSAKQLKAEIYGTSDYCVSVENKSGLVVGVVK